MRPARSGDYELKIRQEPREALVAQDGKGKSEFRIFEEWPCSGLTFSI